MGIITDYILDYNCWKFYVCDICLQKCFYFYLFNERTIATDDTDGE